MNKGKVAEIERIVFARVKEANDSRLQELMELINTDFSDDRPTLVDVKDGSVWCNGRKTVKV